MSLLPPALRESAMKGHPVRETPAPDPLQCATDGPSHPSVENEPVLNADNIQGNTLGGFNKDFQTLLFLRIDDTVAFKKWLTSVVPRLATLSQVVAFNRLFKSMRVRFGEEPPLKVTWINVAFTFEGLKLLRGDADSFTDAAFRRSLRVSSPGLGDPTTSADEGNPANWLVMDGPLDAVNNDRIAHVMFIIAGDDRADVNRTTQDLLARAKGATPVGFLDAPHHGFEDGQNLPNEKDGAGGVDLSGHEHFGFLDGVSQPGVRGRLSQDPRDVLTVRQNPNNRNQGKPGQELIWPGEFVFGYPQGPSNPSGDPEPTFESPGPISIAGPPWANDGSFLVFRRLRQDVAKFHAFLSAVTSGLHVSGAPTEVDADLVGARLVGRWRSGAPVMRTRTDPLCANDQDVPALGNDDCANNNFEFQEETDPLPLTAFADPFDCSDLNPTPPPDTFPPADADKEGLVCPFTAHIRKVYPRDDTSVRGTSLNGQPIRTVDGKEEITLQENDTQTHRILRRGIPFGSPLRHPDRKFSTPQSPAPDDRVSRGLHFLAYQTSIEDQFEFIIKNWVNNPDFKEPSASDPTHPSAENVRGGHDPIIGQNNVRGQKRLREFTVTFTDTAGRRAARRINTDDGAGTGLDWVIPTGGGYFFSPSIHALENELTC
jgi:Dyp-type peroxidase family